MSVIADSNGKLTGSFNVPANVPAGTKRVAFTGSGGSTAEAQYTAQGTLITQVFQQVTTVLWDPLAQTVVLPETRIIMGIDFKVTAKGSSSHPIRCQIREVSLGVPNEVLIATGELDMSTVTAVAPNTVGAWSRILFSTPAVLKGGQEYAFVFMSDDGYHALAIATLGQYAKRLENDKEGWITSQPYTVGTLLASSNNKTWTPFQNSDLCFRLQAAKFTANTATIDYGDIAYTNTTDAMVAVEVARPDPVTDAVFRLTELTGGDVFTIQEFSAIQLTAIKNTNVSVECLLSGSDKMSPIVYPQPQVVIGQIGTTADYISRGFKAAETFDGVVIFEVLKPGQANCVPYLENQTMSGDTRVVDGNGSYVTTFATLTKQSAQFTGDGWIEEKWAVTGLRGVSLDYSTRVKLTLSGTAKDRVYVRNLRAFAK